MRTIHRTRHSRRFSDLLDAIERGETLTITRGHHPVAEIGPARRRTGADPGPRSPTSHLLTSAFADDIADALALVTRGARPMGDA